MLGVQKEAIKIKLKKKRNTKAQSTMALIEIYLFFFIRLLFQRHDIISYHTLQYNFGSKQMRSFRQKQEENGASSAFIFSFRFSVKN